MRRRAGALRPSVAAVIAVVVSLAVATVWALRPRRATEAESALEATRAVRISRHRAIGTKSEERVTRDRARVRAIVEALGVDALAPSDCPADYSTAELGMMLSGDDVYAKRSVYVWDLFDGRKQASVVVVRTSGCRGGPPADAATLRRELARTGISE